MQSAGWTEHAVEHPVQTEAHLQVLLVWFDVDIAGLTLNSLRKNMIDQFDYGCFINLSKIIKKMLKRLRFAELLGIVSISIFAIMI